MSIGSSNVSRAKNQERKIANDLSAWTGATFRRRRAEGRGDEVVGVEGVSDVICVNRVPKFSFEAKCEAGFSMDALLSNPKGCKFTSWWHQATYDAKVLADYSKKEIFPMLFFRPFSGSNWVAFPKCFKFSDNHGVVHDTLWFNHISVNCYDRLGQITSPNPKTASESTALNLLDVVMVRYADMAANINPNSIFY